MKRFVYSDFLSDGKPKINVGLYKFGDRVYSYRCKSNTTLGYGTTTRDSYNAWNRNFKRRINFYKDKNDVQLSYIAKYR